MNSHFFAVIISEQLLLQSEISTEQPLLENRNLFGQLLFETATFLAEELFRKKRYIQKSYFFKAGTSAHHQLFQESYILEKANNSEKQYSVLHTFSGKLPFQSGHFFKRRYLLQHLPFQKTCFFTRYFFRRVNISQLRFLSTAILLTYLLVNK